MSIIIENTSGSRFDPTGENEYAIRINNQHVVYFLHTRTEGLAECLRRAADAVEAAHPTRQRAVENALDEEVDDADN